MRQQTRGQQVDRAYQTGQMPPLLPFGSGGAAKVLPSGVEDGEIME